MVLTPKPLTLETTTIPYCARSIAHLHSVPQAMRARWGIRWLCRFRSWSGSCWASYRRGKGGCGRIIQRTAMGRYAVHRSNATACRGIKTTQCCIFNEYSQRLTGRKLGHRLASPAVCPRIGAPARLAGVNPLSLLTFPHSYKRE